MPASVVKSAAAREPGQPGLSPQARGCSAHSRRAAESHRAPTGGCGAARRKPSILRRCTRRLAVKASAKHAMARQDHEGRTAAMSGSTGVPPDALLA